MQEKTVGDGIHVDRRRFLGGAAMAFVATRLGLLGAADCPASEAAGAVTPAKQVGDKPFGPIHQIDAGDLSIGYAEAGRTDGPAVLLLHGWPYDIHSYVDVAPLLAAKGYRVIIPHLRGHGSTRFLSDGTPRNGQQAVVAVDAVALMDALKIQKAILAGYD